MCVCVCINNGMREKNIVIQTKPILKPFITGIMTTLNNKTVLYT